MKENKDKISVNIFNASIIILGVVLLIIGNYSAQYKIISIISNIIDYVIFVLFLSEISLTIIKTKSIKEFFKNNYLEALIVIIFSTLFILNKFVLNISNLQGISTKIIFLNSGFVALKIFLRIRKLNYFLKKLSSNPAQSIIFSFFIVILVGMIFLMMPFSSSNGESIGFVNALFTSTSAVCVTGLIVLDTAKDFSLFGKIVILTLIQIGGLGIMILSAFAVFIIGKKMSIEEKSTLSFLVNENDTKKLASSIINIIKITLIIELIGMALLFIKFNGSFDSIIKALFYSLFHSISAFCNAGFALFTDSLEQFKSSLIINFTICGLIIAGGISFGVLTNSFAYLRNIIKKRIFNRYDKMIKLNLNTKVVLLITSFLIVLGILLIYQIEHKNTFMSFDLKTQYLSAFFQSVTLRTAGFNSINFNNLRNSTYLIMILFMFIGGASGSTAGGIKVNTLGIIYAYVKSQITGKKNVILLNNFIPPYIVNNAFLIITLYILGLFTGTLLLTFFEELDIMKLIFEVVSALGTVGLSAGITSLLTVPGKFVIILLMFFGRIGPLTILTAFVQKSISYEIKYPEGQISIG